MKLIEMRRNARRYASQEERNAFDDGYSDGWHGQEKDRGRTVEYPNAYSAGYWEGNYDTLADKNRLATGH